MYIKLSNFEHKKDLTLQKIITKLYQNPSKFVIKFFLLFLIAMIMNIHLSRKLDLYHRRLTVRRDILKKSDNVRDFIPHGEIKKSSNKHILFWNKNSYDENVYINQEDLESVSCAVTNCIFSHNRRLLPTVTNYNAIIFHIDNSNDVTELPEKRKSDQIYVMASQRSDPLIKNSRHFGNNFFNMTFTYRRDSDVQWASKIFYDTKLKSIVLPSRQVKWRKPQIFGDPEIHKFFKKSKTKLAAGSFLQCNAQFYHDTFGKEIREYLDIDMYLERNDLLCPIGNSMNKCTEKLNSTYKFYLAYENSICVDYIPEKVFVNMENYIVPIIFNEITEMQHFLPPQSYISVSDFGSIEELANYLKFLDENPQEYANYFWWTKHYKLIKNANFYSYCDLCLEINDWDTNEMRQVYFDIEDWIGKKSCKNIN